MAEDKPIEITTELIEKARAAKSADEIAAIADEQGVEMSGEETASIYASLHEAEGEIADDELDNVAGGGCGEPPPPPQAVLVRRAVPPCRFAGLPRRSKQPPTHPVLLLHQVRGALGEHHYRGYSLALTATSDGCRYAQCYYSNTRGQLGRRMRP